MFPTFHTHEGEFCVRFVQYDNRMTLSEGLYPSLEKLVPLSIHGV